MAKKSVKKQIVAKESKHAQVEKLVTFMINNSFDITEISNKLKKLVNTETKNNGYPRILGVPMSLGNSKLKKAKNSKKLAKKQRNRFIIFNLTSSFLCPSRILNLCKACVSKNGCYADSREIYDDVVQFRNDQMSAWLQSSAHKLAMVFLAACKLFDCNVIRFSESGDILDQDSVYKLAYIGKILKNYGIRCYTYTARTDLNLEPLRNNVELHISNQKQAEKHGFRYCRVEPVEKQYNPKKQPVESRKQWVELAKIINKNGRNERLCPEDCSVCNMCQHNEFNIVFRGHGNRQNVQPVSWEVYNWILNHVQNAA